MLTKQELEDAGKEFFEGKDLARVWFYIVQLSHALTNVPRELLRSMGAPDAPGDKRNWADNLALGLTISIVFGPILWLIFKC